MGNTPHKIAQLYYGSRIQSDDTNPQRLVRLDLLDRMFSDGILEDFGMFVGDTEDVCDPGREPTQAVHSDEHL